MSIISYLPRGFLLWFFESLFSWSPILRVKIIILLPEVVSCKNHTEMFRVVDFLLKYDYEAWLVKLRCFQPPIGGSSYSSPAPTHRSHTMEIWQTTREGVGKVTERKTCPKRWTKRLRWLFEKDKLCQVIEDALLTVMAIEPELLLPGLVILMLMPILSHT